MKRLICICLATLMLLMLCACGDKKQEEKDKPDETQTLEESKTSVPEEIVTAPEDDGTEEKKPEELGTLPIIFGDDKNDEQKDGQTNTPGTDVPKTSTTKKPPTTTTKGNSSTVVETPIIPFN